VANESNLLSTPEGYATPAQLQSTREYAKALLQGNLQQPVHHWTQGVSNMISALVGGNMDFNEIVEGATIYLPVSVPGALLYLGDAHAVQGDGELNGNALETSLDVEFTVDVIPRRRTPGPRVESSTHVIAMGLGGSLDDAFKSATANMAGWIAEDYKLTPPEIAELFGTAAEYRVSEVADRNAGVVLKINKERLLGLKSKDAN